MAITSGSAERVMVPHEPGEWIELKRLGWKQLERAKTARTTAAMQSIAALGDISSILQSAASRAPETPAEPDPLSEYDQETLLLEGISAWSYEEEVNQITIGRLDPETAEWAARQLLPIKRTEEERSARFLPSSTTSTGTEIPRTSG